MVINWRSDNIYQELPAKMRVRLEYAKTIKEFCDAIQAILDYIQADRELEECTP